MSKIFWLDTETTGLDPVKHDIIQLAGIVEIDGEVKEEFEMFMQPQPDAPVSKEALEINGWTVEQLREFPLPKDQHTYLNLILAKYCDRYDKQDKFLIGGQNPKFDIDFLREFYLKNNDKFFGSWFNYHHIDTTTIGALAEYKGAQLPNFKLETLCKYFKIELQAHDALQDIRATREIFYKFAREYLK